MYVCEMNTFLCKYAYKCDETSPGGTLLKYFGGSDRRGESTSSDLAKTQQTSGEEKTVIVCM